MNLNDINEVWLALEAERAKIDLLFKKVDSLVGIPVVECWHCEACHTCYTWPCKCKGKPNGKKKEDSKT